MKIWILNHHAREYGRHPSLAKYLSDTNEVSLFSSSFIHNTFVEEKVYQKNEYYIEENVDNYERVYIKTPKYYGNGLKRLINQLSFTYKSYLVGKKKIKTETTPEVIIGSSVHLFAGLSAYLLARKSNAKFIFEIRDIWPQTLVDIGALKKDSVITKFFERLEKFLYKKADMIISVLPEGHKHIRKYGVSVDKVFHLPNGIDVDSYLNDLSQENTNEKIRSFFDERKDKKIFTYSGSFGKANGLSVIVDTAEILKEHEFIHFLLVGDGPEKNDILEKINAKKLKNITVMDRVPKASVAHILRESDSCIFHLNKTPVFKYGISSNKLFDYMISNKPIVFAVETSTKIVLDSNSGVPLSPENPKEMARVVLRLSEQLRTKEKNEQDKSEGYEYIIKNHDYEVLAEKLMDKINEF